jgi:hypothetical protein
MIRVMYLRDSNGLPVGCLAIKLNGSKTVTYQYSVLNPLDKFDREVSRVLAKGRLVENPITVSLPFLASRHDISEAVLRDILSNSSAPSRARRAARLWLRTNIQTKSNVQVNVASVASALATGNSVSGDLTLTLTPGTVGTACCQHESVHDSETPNSKKLRVEDRATW